MNTTQPANPVMQTRLAQATYLIAQRNAWQDRLDTISAQIDQLFEPEADDRA
jgi:hypothetical protein